MDRLLADGAGLPGLSEPGIHTAAVVGMSTGEDPQLVPILILIQADGTDIILVSLLIVMCRNLFQLLFGQSILLEPFSMLDTTNYHHCSHGQNQQSHNPCERDEVIAQGEAIVWDQKHSSPGERKTSIRRSGKAKEQRKKDKVNGCGQGPWMGQGMVRVRQSMKGLRLGLQVGI